MEVKAHIASSETKAMTDFDISFIVGYPEEHDAKRATEKFNRFIKHIEQKLEQLPESVLLSLSTDDLISINLGFSQPHVQLNMLDKLFTVEQDNSVSLFIEFVISEIS